MIDPDAPDLLADILEELHANIETRQRLTVRAHLLTECATRLRTGEGPALVRARLGHVETHRRAYGQ